MSSVPGSRSASFIIWRLRRFGWQVGAAAVLGERGHVARHMLGLVHRPHMTALTTEVVVDVGVLARVLEPAGIGGLAVGAAVFWRRHGEKLLAHQPNGSSRGNRGHYTVRSLDW